MKTPTTEFRNHGPINGDSHHATFDFEATDVTRTHSIEARNVQRSTPAGAVARSLAARMSLPQNVPWGLRDDQTGTFLDDNLPIGKQIESDAKVTLTPKTHLG